MVFQSCIDYHTRMVKGQMTQRPQQQSWLQRGTQLAGHPLPVTVTDHDFASGMLISSVDM